MIQSINMNDETQYSLLVVEDDKPLHRAIKAKLEREGFSALVAVDVDQAISYIDDEDVQVDAVWLDHYLFGDKNGLDFISHLKDKGILDKIPVFVVTNTGGHEKKETYLQFGAVDYYVKSNNRLDEIAADIKKKLLELSGDKA